MGLQVSKKDAERIFKKLMITKKACSHHIRGFIEVDGIKCFPVHYSKGNGDMPGHVGKKFQKSFRINELQFCGLRDCPLSASDYYYLIKEKMKNGF